MKYSIVTGACGGLGSAFAKTLASQGKNLILVGTNKERLEKQKTSLISEYGNIKIETVVCDQSKKEHRQSFFKDIKAFDIETAILNAGYIDEGPLCNKSDEQIEGVIRTNCEGTILLGKGLIEKSKKDNQELSLLVTSSLSAFYPMPQMAIYAASKSMLLNFFLAMREEERKNNINISVLCPGGIPTTQAMKDAIAAQGLGGKLSALSPEKIAKIALRGLEKKKAYIVPGFFNKFLKFAGTAVPRTFVARQIGRRWSKSQKKRS